MASVVLFFNDHPVATLRRLRRRWRLNILYYLYNSTEILLNNLINNNR